MNTGVDTLESLIAAAENEARAGRMGEADTLWRRVLARDANNGRALFALGARAINTGDFVDAVNLLRRGCETNADPMMHLALSTALRNQHDAQGELEAIDRALALDPYFFPGLLAKAALYERAGLNRQAALTYRNVLKIEPDGKAWPPHFRQQFEHASSAVAADQQRLRAHVEERLAPVRARHPGADGARIEECLDIFVGAAKPKLQEPTRVLFPRLPPTPFYDRRNFDWLPALEAKTDAIRAEFLAARAARGEGFRPYIAFRPGQPVNQWQELNNSKRWSTLFLWKDGKEEEGIAALCPETTAALNAIPIADLPNLCPTAMFSVLAPKTRIPPHTGETNVRLVVHLPLIVPECCGYRVGNARTQWKVGEALIFDDSIEHEAWNDSDEDRAVLIFDIWNPHLTLAERDMAAAIFTASLDYYR